MQFRLCWPRVNSTSAFSSEYVWRIFNCYFLCHFVSLHKLNLWSNWWNFFCKVTKSLPTEWFFFHIKTYLNSKSYYRGDSFWFQGIFKLLIFWTDRFWILEQHAETGWGGQKYFCFLYLLPLLFSEFWEYERKTLIWLWMRA